MADLDRLFAPLRLAAVAGHGAELRVPGSAAPQHFEAAIPAELRRRLIEFGASHEGLILEDKGYSLALHYRLLPQWGASVHAAVAAICADYPQCELDVLAGKSVVEVKPSGFNKGTGIRELMQHRTVPRTPADLHRRRRDRRGGVRGPAGVRRASVSRSDAR